MARQLRRSRRIPPLRIAGKIYIAGFLVLFFAFLLTAASSWVITGNQAQTYIDSNIDSDLASFQTDLDQETRDLSALGNWLAVQPTLGDLVQNRDTDGLARYLLPWMQASIVDSLVVADQNGVVLVRIRTDQPMSQGDNISELNGVAEALHGQSASGFDKDQYGRLQGRLILPITASPQAAPTGVLALGFFLDGDFFTHLTRESSHPFAIVFQKEVHLSNLTDESGNRRTPMPVTDEVMAAERAGQATGPVILQFGRQRYQFRFKPLQSPSKSTVGMYGAGVSLDLVAEQHRALFDAFGLALLGALACTAVIGYLLVRTLVQPINALALAAQKMAGGDLSTGIAVNRRDELGDLAREMDAMREQLRSALQNPTLEKSRDEFMLNVAHELRGPLASLRSFVDLMSEDYESLDKREARLLLQALERAVIRFQRLVENLIDIGSIQAGRFRVRPAPTELDRMVREAVEQVESRLKANDQRLELCGMEAGVTVLADAPRVVQVLVNFLTNASKYSPENQTIVVSVTTEERRMRLAVTDHGAGISTEELPHIFERFYRTKRAETEGIGIGIGLALSKAIIEAHGGEVGVISEEGRGSTFWFTLSLAGERGDGSTEVQGRTAIV